MAKLTTGAAVTIDHSEDGWSEFRKWLDGTYASLRCAWVDEGPAYSVVAMDGSVCRVCSLNKADAADFETYYKFNRSAGAPKTSDGRTRTAFEKSDTTKATVISHDWTDPTTWTEKSVRVVDETATDSGNHLTYSLAHQNVIDTYHGKVSQEDSLLDSEGRGYRVAVKVNGSTKTEQDPHYGSGGDYVVNYEAGSLTFLSAQSADAVVTVTYHYANGSQFTVKPTAGKTLKIEAVEVQFSDDVEIMDSAIFQPYGFVEVFAPQYCTTNGGPYPPGTKIPLGAALVYKSMTDYQNEAVKSYCTYPPLGGDGWRGSSKGIVILDWDYVSATVLRSDYGLEIRVSLQHDQPFGGWYATATFYCTSENL